MIPVIPVVEGDKHIFLLRVEAIQYVNRQNEGVAVRQMVGHELRKNLGCDALLRVHLMLFHSRVIREEDMKNENQQCGPLYIKG